MVWSLSAYKQAIPVGAASEFNYIMIYPADTESRSYTITGCTLYF